MQSFFHHFLPFSAYLYISVCFLVLKKPRPKRDETYNPWYHPDSRKNFYGHSLLRNVHHTAFSTVISRTQLTREIHLPSEPKGTFSLLIPSLYWKMAHYLHGHCLYLIIPNYCIIWLRVVKSEILPLLHIPQNHIYFSTQQ